MDLSIIIVNWNGGDTLLRCLSSIKEHGGPLAIQVIVVDNNSSDGSRQAAQRDFPGFHVFNSGSNLGFGKANNLARSLVKSNLVLFLNPDTVVLEGSLPAMVQFLRDHPDVGAVGGKMCDPDGNPHDLPLQWSQPPWTQFINLLLVSGRTPVFLKKFLPFADSAYSRYTTALYGGCIMAREHVLDGVGWFDERYFMYAEDIDLCYSIRKAGSKLYYLSTAPIIHTAGHSSGKATSGFAILMKSESIAKLMKKHYGALGAWLYRLATLATSAMRFLALLFLRAGAALSTSKSPIDFSAAFEKYKTLLLWSLGLRKPVIAS